MRNCILISESGNTSINNEKFIIRRNWINVLFMRDANNKHIARNAITKKETKK